MSTIFTYLLVISILNTIQCSTEIDDEESSVAQASIQAIPPGVSLFHNDPKMDNFINIRLNKNKDEKLDQPSYWQKNPFLTNSLLQAIVEESEQKRRVQRYRDIEK